MKVAILLLGIIVFSEAAFTWKDCVPSTTAHPYVTFTSMSLSPSPVVFPGNVTVGIQATVHHHFGSDVKIRVHMDKLLLGQWTNVPCNNNFWSCNYDNPCQFFSPYKIMETCPAQFVAHGIPCTCPFNPNTIDLPPSVFVVPHIDPKWSPVLTGKFRVKVEMIHGGDIVGCFEIELDTKHHHSGGGFLFR
nr:ganglioside GM2 activator [Crassostrea gigas]